VSQRESNISHREHGDLRATREAESRWKRRRDSRSTRTRFDRSIRSSLSLSLSLSRSWAPSDTLPRPRASTRSLETSRVTIGTCQSTHERQRDARTPGNNEGRHAVPHVTANSQLTAYFAFQLSRYFRFIRAESTIGIRLNPMKRGRRKVENRTCSFQNSLPLSAILSRSLAGSGSIRCYRCSISSCPLHANLPLLSSHGQRTRLGNADTSFPRAAVGIAL